MKIESIVSAIEHIGIDSGDDIATTDSETSGLTAGDVFLGRVLAAGGLTIILTGLAVLRWPDETVKIIKSLLGH